MTDLRELEKRLEDATGPSQTLDRQINDTLGLPPIGYPRFTSSLDAAVALVERIFPEREWALSVDKENGKACADVADDVWDESFENIRAFSKAPPLALCLALVRALIAAKGDRHD